LHRRFSTLMRIRPRISPR